MAAKGMTLYEQKHAFTFVVSEDSDGAGYLSRDAFVAEGGANGVDFLVGEIFAVVDGKVVKLNTSDLTWPAGVSAADKAEIVAQMDAALIKIR